MPETEAPLTFLPQPKKVLSQRGHYSFFPGRLVLLQSEKPQLLVYTARLVLQALPEASLLRWELSAGWSAPQSQVGLTLQVDPNSVPQAQGYHLLVTPDGIQITGHDEAGVYYGACTLIQALRQAGKPGLACFEVWDWPDFAVRGVMLDVSRDRVPQMSTLYELVERLAGWKINQLQLYTEHTFSYRNHPEVWAHASPLTGGEILALDAFCRENFIDLVPNQNSFGHLQPWLKLPRYAALAEIHGEYQAPWGRVQGPNSLAPLHPGSLELIRSLYAELLPHFSSRLFNVGCDETHDLGQGQSKAACQELGRGRVYLDFLLKINQEVRRHGRTMQFWGDIILNDPQLVAELPRDALALLWGYEAQHPFAQEAAIFARSGLSFYVSPGTSSWCSLAGRTENMLANLLNAAEAGLHQGAAGYLITDWGDRGHWQALPVSYAGFAAGAAYSWGLEANRSLDLAGGLSLHAFGDPSGSLGPVMLDLGNVYRHTGQLFPNGSTLFWALQWPLERIAEQPGWDRNAIERSLAAIDEALLPLKHQKMQRPDAALVLEEIQYTARMMRHACRRSLLALEGDSLQARQMKPALWNDLQELLSLHRSLWLARSRPGGYPESRKRLERLIQDYQ